MKGSCRGGLEFAGRYLAVILIAFAFIILTVYFFAWSALGDNSVFSIGSLILAVIPSMVPFAILATVAFMAGYCPPGTTERLYVRFIMDAFKLFCIFYTAHSFEYALGALELDPEYGVMLSGTSIVLDLTIVATILALLPLMSMLDNVLEYRQNRSGDAADD